MSFLQVRRPGLLSTIQDRGRWGYQDRGVPVSGAMDWYSHRAANLLVGNQADAATLEVTLRGPEVELDVPACVAVAGAEFELTVDGRPMGMHTPACLNAGSRLSFGERTRGSRAYLAVAGGILVQPWLGSRATHLVSRTGGLEGRAIRLGDRLPIAAAPQPVPVSGQGPAPLPPWLPCPHGTTLPHTCDRLSFDSARSSGAEGARVRVLPGPHADRFGEGALDRLAACRFVVSGQSDRMGYRLQGPGPRPLQDRELLSASMPNGSLQILPSGEPILLMADRATSGGYPVLAIVITADLAIAGQLAPGDWIEFVPCSLAEARAALRGRERALGGA